ncbi:endonuclease NucS domain-containing protein [Actinomadura sp. NTSP31]|uniref:endonuclease NucS domain-containing protein n=1 Tax=Actinomadura sp. NTSP31 TaxID=1735447 RepID=UPI0035BF068B
MPVEVGLWRVDSGKPQRMNSTAIELEKQLEDLIEQDPAILGYPLLIIGRQVQTKTGGTIDLLGMDEEGNLHVLELKRGRTPREVVAQALDYGSWVSGLTHKDIKALYEACKHTVPFEAAFSKTFGTSPPDELNSSHTLTIVAHDADAATERIVTYLSAFDVPVNVAFFRYFTDDGRKYLARTWLVSENAITAQTSSAKKTRERWNGQDWYVAFGVDNTGIRVWDDARQYGFISAGGGVWYSKTLRKLPVGDRVFVHIPQSGYVGVGTVTRQAQPFTEAVVDFDGQEQRLRDLDLQGTYVHSTDKDEDITEYVVAVEWEHIRPQADAFWVAGLFANQNSACPMRSSFTIDTLTKKFQLDT